jgi:hypothetical protein
MCSKCHPIGLLTTNLLTRAGDLNGRCVQTFDWYLLMRLILWCFYSKKNEKPSGFLLGWDKKYGAVYLAPYFVLYIWQLFSLRIPMSCGQGSRETGIQFPNEEEGVGFPCK